MTYRAKVVAHVELKGKLLLLVRTSQGKQAIPLRDKLQQEFFPDGCTVKVRTRADGEGVTFTRLDG